MPGRISRRQFALESLALGSLALGSSLLARQAPAQGGRSQAGRNAPVIPGTGIRINRTGDDFETEDWAYYPNHPKSSWNIDENIREPGSSAKNFLWAEGAKRGTPDVVKRVPTPPGGIEGSTGSMLIQTLRSGIPGTITHQQQQDDLLHNVSGTVGRTIPCAWSPNCVCRVFVPPVKYWERRDGATFGYRTGLLGVGNGNNNEEYWPGIFLHMERPMKDGKQTPVVRSWIRADQYGRDMPSLTFEPESWITMGISHTPDGQVHFFQRAGIDDLTKEDCVGSYWCYGYRAHSFQTFFYNVINQDDGRSVSSPWIIDDAMLFAATPPANKIRMAGGQPGSVPPATR